MDRMVDTLEDIGPPPYRSGDSEKVERKVLPIDDTRIEALIADFESNVGNYSGNRIDWIVEVDVMRALIASWYKQGEQIVQLRKWGQWHYESLMELVKYTPPEDKL
jgi:hypothetical protein